MIKIYGSISKKVPLPNVDYSSQSYSAGLEVEIASNATTEQIQQKIREVYSTLEVAVNEQINDVQVGTGSNSQSHNCLPDNGNGNGGNGNGNRIKNGNANATDKQVGLIHSLAKEVSLTDADLDTACTRLFQSGFNNINKMNASSLIKMLQDVKNGKMSASSLK